MVRPSVGNDQILQAPICPLGLFLSLPAEDVLTEHPSMGKPSPCFQQCSSFKKILAPKEECLLHKINQIHQAEKLTVAQLLKKLSASYRT
jgi:hypothetical protein